MADDELPEGWTSTPIRDLVEIHYGKSLREDKRSVGSIPVYGSNGVVGTHNVSLTSSSTIILGRKGSIGEVHLCPSGCWPIDTTYYIDEFCDTDPRFLAAVLRSLDLSELDTSTAIPGLNRDDIYAQMISLPPLAEQKRLVTQLDRCFDTVASVSNRLSKLRMILKRFRQAVLMAGCSGRLTEDWRGTHESEPIRDLYERAQKIRAERYASDCETALSNGRRRPADPRKSERSHKPVVDLPEFPEQWGLFPLQDLTHLVTDGTHRTPVYVDKGIPFLSVKNVRPFRVRDKDVKRISLDEHREINLRCNPAVGDILYTKVGATFGYAAVNRLHYPFSLFVSVALLKLVQECFIPEYAEIALNSDVVYRQAADRVSGSGTPDLHLIEIRDFRIPLPPLAEQTEIVGRVHRLFQRADVIGQHLATAEERTGKLTQSILARAFSGELVPTEAELARHEGREYEPASVLLERIRAERANQVKKRPIPRRKLKKSTLLVGA